MITTKVASGAIVTELVGAPRNRRLGSTLFEKTCLFVLLALSVFGLTPVAVFGEGVESPDAAGDSLQQFSFSALLCIVGARLLHTRGIIELVRLPIGLVILLVWLWLSILWAIDPVVAARRVTFCTVVVFSVCYIVTSLSFEEIIRALVVFAVTMLAIDWLAVCLLPLSIHQASGPEPELVGAWRGFHSHKNSAGAVLALTLILLLQPAARMNFIYRALFVAGAGYFLFKTQSKTSMGFLPVSLVVGLLASRCYRRPILQCGLFLGLAVILFAVYEGSLVQKLSDLMNDPAALTGRVQIWPLLIDYAKENLWLGAGYGSFWAIEASPIQAYTSGWIASINHAHNGYLNLQVQVGLIGLAAALTLLIIRPLQISFTAPLKERTSRSYLASIITFVALNNILESSLVDRADPVWVLLIICLVIVDKNSIGAWNDVPTCRRL